jgi:hypothetical protein
MRQVPVLHLLRSRNERLLYRPRSLARSAPQRHTTWASFSYGLDFKALTLEGGKWATYERRREGTGYFKWLPGVCNANAQFDFRMTYHRRGTLSLIVR